MLAQSKDDRLRRSAVAAFRFSSLAELAEKAQLYVGVLVQAVSQAKHEGTRRQAAEALRAFASDEAIRDALEGRLDP